MVVHVLLLIVVIVAPIDVLVGLTVVDYVSKSVWVVKVRLAIGFLVCAVIRTIISLIPIIVTLLINTNILPKLMIRFVQSLSRLDKVDPIIL